MATSDLTWEIILQYFIDMGGKVRNRDVVSYFKPYLTDPATKEDARVKFKQYVNMLAHVRLENNEKFLVLKSRYLPSSQEVSMSPQFDPRNSVGIPLSPSTAPEFPLPSQPRTPNRQPPPYRPPPPVTPNSPSSISLNSFSNISMTSLNSLPSEAPQAPPRRRSADKLISINNNKENEFNSGIVNTPKKEDGAGGEDMAVSVKERTQKFNRMASIEDELSSSPRHGTPKSAEKASKIKGADENDGAFDKPLEPKKCVEWCVTASKGDLQELLKLAKTEPALVKKKDPFTAYTVLHWGAKYGNQEIIKVFAGKYKVDVNGKTNGGYTPLHIAAQFGHKDIFKLLIEVYKADPNIRDYSGKTPDYYLLAKEREQGEGKVPLRKLKSRKKQSDKDLGFLRIGSLNVRVKKTTEAFSNFLGVTSSILPMETMQEKVHKGWGSMDNVTKDDISMPAPKTYPSKKKSKRTDSSSLSSVPSTPRSSVKSLGSKTSNDSDSDTAAGFDSNWKN